MTTLNGHIVKSFIKDKLLAQSQTPYNKLKNSPCMTVSGNIRFQCSPRATDFKQCSPLPKCQGNGEHNSLVHTYTSSLWVWKWYNICHCSMKLSPARLWKPELWSNDLQAHHEKEKKMSTGLVMTICFICGSQWDKITIIWWPKWMVHPDWSTVSASSCLELTQMRLVM